MPSSCNYAFDRDAAVEQHSCKVIRLISTWPPQKRFHATPLRSNMRPSKLKCFVFGLSMFLQKLRPYQALIKFFVQSMSSELDLKNGASIITTR